MSERARIPVRQRLRSLLFRVPVSEEVDSELAFHLEMRTRDLVATGMEPREARRVARERFGDLDDIRRECRRIAVSRERSFRLRDSIGDLTLDLRFAVRRTLREKTASAVIVLTLALGIGAATSMFSVVNAVLVRPLPFPDSDSLVRVFGTSSIGNRGSISDVETLEITKANSSFTEVAAVSLPSPPLTLLSDGDPVRLSSLFVTGSLFRILGTTPGIGRTFSREEDLPGSRERVVVLTHSLWTKRFGGDDAMVGATLTLDGESWTVIGVLPRDFRFLADVDVYVPYALRSDFEPGDRRLEAFARLRAGVTLARAQEDVDAIASRLREAYPESNRGYGFELLGFRDWIIGPRAARISLTLFASVGLFLLVASANVSNLLVARVATEAREIGLRSALGAGRRRIIRQLLTEALALSILGAFLALLIARGTMALIVSRAAHTLPRIEEVTLDATVIAFAVLATTLVGLGAGLFPALHALRREPSETLRVGRSPSSREGRRLRAALVVSQLAAATVLVVAGVLVLRSFRELVRVDPGFATDGVLVCELSLPAERYPESSDAVRDFYRLVTSRINAIPAVESAAATAVNPFRGLWLSNTVGRESWTERADFIPIQWRAVTPGYFETMSIPILRGRAFNATDRTRRASVITKSLADKLWPGEDPIGKQFRWIFPRGALVTVIGVARDIRDQMLDAEPLPMVYHNQERFGWPDMTLMVRTRGDVRDIGARVREAVWEVDPYVPVPELYPLERNLSEAVAAARFTAQLLTLFAIVALAVAAVGTYATISYAVTRRQREIGIRMALGARHQSVIRLVTNDGLRLVISGVALGVLGAYLLAGFLRGMLFETAPHDLAAFALGVTILTVTGLLASYVPALRAAKVSPLLALRDT